MILFGWNILLVEFFKRIKSNKTALKNSTGKRERIVSIFPKIAKNRFRKINNLHFLKVLQA